jgi:hypothetical protein
MDGDSIMKFLHKHLILFFLVVGLQCISSRPADCLEPLDIRSIVYVMSGAPAPISAHNSIRLDSEYITIRLQKFTYQVDADYDFVNTGGAVSEIVGFPFYGPRLGGKSTRPPFIIRFDIWIDGTKITLSDELAESKIARAFPKRLRPGEKMEYTWVPAKVTFPAHAGVKIRTVYKSVYLNGKAHFIYGPSSMWKGRIAKGAFTVDGSDIGGLKNLSIDFPTSPGPRLMSKNVLRYDLEDFEPWPAASLSLVVLTKTTKTTKTKPLPPQSVGP